MTWKGSLCLDVDPCILHPCNNNESCIKLGDLGRRVCLKSDKKVATEEDKKMINQTISSLTVTRPSFEKIVNKKSKSIVANSTRNKLTSTHIMINSVSKFRQTLKYFIFKFALYIILFTM